MNTPVKNTISVTTRKVWVLAALFVANFFILGAVFAEERGGVLTVAFLDVGQGDAVLTMQTQ